MHRLTGTNILKTGLVSRKRSWADGSLGLN